MLTALLLILFVIIFAVGFTLIDFARAFFWNVAGWFMLILAVACIFIVVYR